MSAKEVGAHLRVSRQRVHQLRAFLGAVKVGHGIVKPRYRFHRAEVERFAAARAVMKAQFAAARAMIPGSK